MHLFQLRSDLLGISLLLFGYILVPIFLNLVRKKYKYMLLWMMAIVPSISYAQSMGDIRLYGWSNSRYYGRLEVYDRDGQWTSVCDDFWDDLDVSVASRQLGCSSASWWITTSLGGTSIWINAIYCEGDESRLIDCRYYTAYDNDDCNTGFLPGIIMMRCLKGLFLCANSERNVHRYSIITGTTIQAAISPKHVL